MDTTSYIRRLCLMVALLALIAGVSCAKEPKKVPVANITGDKNAAAVNEQMDYKPKATEKVVGIKQTEILDLDTVFFEGATDLKERNKKENAS